MEQQPYRGASYRRGCTIKMAVVLLCLFSVTAGFEHTKEEIDSLKGKRLLNMDQVQAGVGFSNIYESPYPVGRWYNTNINLDTKCWVVYTNTERSEYRLETSDSKPSGDSHLTHHGQCGVCSTLQDLAVYIETPDLTNPVRSCTLRFFGPLQLSCLQEIGFTKECAYIWYYNAKNTGSISPLGGCFSVCIANICTPNNQPVGSYNPCEPEPDQLENYENVVDGVESVPPVAPFCLPCAKSGLCCSRSTRKTGLCGNTINNKPACHPEQYKNGPYRLNPCLQCDECRSGPIFQKVAGRTRRASGLASAIERPLEHALIHHSYGASENHI